MRNAESGSAKLRHCDSAKTTCAGANVMTADEMRPHQDTLSFTDNEAFVFEAVATLEYTGQPTTREHIRAVVTLDEATIDAALAELTGRNVLTVEGAGAEETFRPADRGWSVAPEQGQGM